MPRGRSMRPHGARSPPAVPAELQNSLFAVPSFALAATTTTAAAAAAPPSSPTTAAAMMATAMHEAAREQVRVFDDAGKLTTRQVGISVFHFRPLTLFYRLRAQSWAWLLSFSVLSYLAIVLTITLMYYAWSAACGAARDTSFIVSLYFTVVSLAANGGYMGEDMRAMTNAAHVCYTGRTMLVMLCSYVNILFVGLVVALVVSKATYTGTLSNRIVFSDFCSLTAVPCRESATASKEAAGVGGDKTTRHGGDTARQQQQQQQQQTAAVVPRACTRCGSCGVQWRLCFRMANMENTQPLAHGNLRLFCVTAEPLKEYRQERRAQRYKRRVAQHKQQQQQQQQQQQSGQDDEQQATTMTTAGDALPRNTTTVEQPQQQPQPQPQQQSSPHSPEDTSHGSAQTNSSVSTQRDDQFSHDATGATTATTTRYSAPPPTMAATGGGGSGYGTLHTRTAAAAARAMTDYTPLLSRHHRGGDSSNDDDGDNHARYRDAAAAVRTMTTPPSSSSLSVVGEHAYLHALPEDAMARVRVNVREMRWSCPEETYLDHGVSGQLSLWYPATITHLVDEHSPLYRFVDAAMQDADEHDSQQQQQQQHNNSKSSHRRQHDDSHAYGGSVAGSVYATANTTMTRARHAGVLSRKFQIVAVFSATEMETGATIMAKHTYIASDIVTDAKFSSKLVHMQPYRGDVLLDYHYFNELLPMTVSESSTTDSDSN